ncbi:MAG TPA: 50S ribosomal protein L15 [Candidatus Hydrogenedentes bacterium]|nr:50S ribosomal protein L15 [Candidatus Hydrogenedentota bacterium]HOL77754.1 50S ribosomal protein L15 [Candidatus Hydrogenedentota bacterium]HPO86432.1 50S ribosomal protein L15 [Candidatus Hydrogenedentota bacterium]
MDLSTLTYAPGARKNRKRAGRGPSSGLGKTAGRGHKGQKSRSGYARRRGFEGGQMPLNRRIPKTGFRHQNRFAPAVVNIDVLEEHFEPGSEVNLEVLVKRGLVEPQPGGLKVLGRGELTKSLHVCAHAFSDGARRKIEAAGGRVELVTLKTAQKDKTDKG